MAEAKSLAVLKVVLPLVGLAVLPLAGLVYAGTANFGPKSSASASASAAASSGKRTPTKTTDEPDEDTPTRTTPTSLTPPPVAKPTSLVRTGGNSRAPQHTLCCEKLMDMSQSASPKDKATLQAAAAACSAAASYDGALKQIAGIVEGAVELPTECQKN